MHDENPQSIDEQTHYRLLAENVHDLVCLHRTDGTYDYVSQSCAALLGFAPEELVGTSPYDLIHEEEINCVREDMFERLPGAERSAVSDYRMRKKNGEYVWVETLARVVPASGEKPAQILTVSRDISERKNAERELAAAQEEIAKIYFSEQAARKEAEIANRAKDEFLQLMSHEFRTPLTTIKTLARILQQGGETADERREYCETIVGECDRQIDMIVNLLDVARIEQSSVDLRCEPVNINRLLRSCEKLERHAAHERGQNFIVRTDDNLPPVRGDEKAVRRALCAIIENAVKYTPNGGTIEIFTERKAHDEIESNEPKNLPLDSISGESNVDENNALSSEEIAIVVSDTGRGISGEDVPKLFDKFYRGAKPANRHDDGASERGEAPGVGLGLYLANRLIRELGGRIEVESEIGRGSRFKIYLAVWDDCRDRRDTIDEYGFDEGES